MKTLTRPTPRREAVKNPKPLERLADSIFKEWGMDAVLENGESVRVVFHDNAQHSHYGATASTHDGLSESTLTAVMGTVDVRKKDLLTIGIEPKLGMHLQLADYSFRVINEPRQDILMDCWQLDVMESDS